VEAGLLCSLVGETKLTMCSGKIYLELRPCFSGNRSGLPCLISVGGKSRVNYKGVCHIDDHGGAIGLPARYCKGSSVLEFLEKRLDRLIMMMISVGAIIE
jgi:hypothetical protein